MATSKHIRIGSKWYDFADLTYETLIKFIEIEVENRKPADWNHDALRYADRFNGNDWYYFRGYANYLIQKTGQGIVCKFLTPELAELSKMEEEAGIPA